jgi:hypothetical protein
MHPKVAVNFAELGKDSVALLFALLLFGEEQLQASSWARGFVGCGGMRGP